MTNFQRLSSVLLFTFLCLCFYQPSLSQTAADRIERACGQYRPQIEDAVQRHFRQDFQEPNALVAQYYQESLCDPSAVSPVGAKGIAQFMPATALDMGKFFGSRFDPHSLKAIRYGAYYQNSQMRVWKRRGRTPDQMWQLGLACYNAGCGNILKAQRECQNGLTWDDINPCLYKITGRHHKETITYVSRIGAYRTALDGAEGAARVTDQCPTRKLF